jgi:hypothetical protein
MRAQLLDTYSSTIFALLDADIENICLEALFHAYPDNREHMVGRFNAAFDFEEAVSCLWMMNMDSTGRERVSEYFENMGIDTRFLTLIMAMYNNFTMDNYPMAWEIFDERKRDALAMIRYIVDNHDEASEECASVVLAFLR